MIVGILIFKALCDKIGKKNHFQNFSADVDDTINHRIF